MSRMLSVGCVNRASLAVHLRNPVDLRMESLTSGPRVERVQTHRCVGIACYILHLGPERQLIKMLEFRSQSETDTDRLGRVIADAVGVGTTIALIGDLGAGKTRLTRAICAALGVDSADVTSPTFVLIQEYAGRLPVYHFDTYRLRDLDEFDELGAEEYFESDGVCLVEWADRVTESLPRDRLQIEITIAGETERRFTLTATGERSTAMLDMIEREFDA